MTKDSLSIKHFHKNAKNNGAWPLMQMDSDATWKIQVTEEMCYMHQTNNKKEYQIKFRSQNNDWIPQFHQHPLILIHKPKLDAKEYTNKTRTILTNKEPRRSCHMKPGTLLNFIVLYNHISCLQILMKLKLKFCRLNLMIFIFP